MFRKRLVVLGVAAVIVGTLLIPPVRAAAVSALSIFRVADVKTIRITASDLRDMMTFMEANNASGLQDTEAREILDGIMENAASEVQTLSDIRDFKAFPFHLPTALKEETPMLSAVDSQAQTVTLDTEEINAALGKLGAAALLDSGLNGIELTVTTPPAIVAEYAEVTLAATQNVYVDAPDAVMNSLYASLLSIPAIPENLRAQLAVIDPKTRDIYLPVIEGLGRETDLGGTTGYVYATGDLSQVLGMLSGFDDDAQLGQLAQENASVLVWTKDGVLWFLAGALSDSELSQIARSIG